MNGDPLKDYQAMLARIRDMSPVEPRLRQIYMDGKREHLLKGQDADGVEFKKVKPATQKRRKGFGPPLAPGYSASRIISKYMVRFEWLPSTLRVIAEWPMDWVKYHRTGTKNKDGTERLPKRDPGGFRDKDRFSAMQALREWVYEGKR